MKDALETEQDKQNRPGDGRRRKATPKESLAEARMRWLLLCATLLLVFLSLLISAYVHDPYLFGASVSLLALITRSLFARR